MLLTNQWLNKKSKEKIKKISGDKWKWKYNMLKSMGCSEDSSKREVQYCNANLPQEIRKISIKQSNFTPKATKKRTTNKA